MDFDVVGDDEFLARESDAVVRDERETKKLPRDCPRSSSPSSAARQVFQIRALHVERESAIVNEPDVPFGARDGDGLAVMQQFRGVFRPDDGRNAEFAADDGRMTGAAAAIGHDRRGLFHDRFPVRIGFVSHQNLAFLKIVDVLDRLSLAPAARNLVPTLRPRIKTEPRDLSR